MEIRPRLSTGLQSLDTQINGGFVPGELALIYGESGTGKTALTISSASMLLRSDAAAKVIYIDNDSKFTPQRFIQVAGSEEKLRRLIYSRPTTFEEQADVINQLPEQLVPGDLACIDSITGLYRVETGDSQKTFSENKELNRQLGFLKETALTCRAAIILTGQVRSILDSIIPAVEPVAQRLLRYWSDRVIKLESTARQGVKQANVEKPQSLRSVCRFRITEKGLEEY